MPYRIEISPNSRAICKATDCKKNKVKIPKGEIRHGVFVTINDWQSWTWRHWGCVTPKVISNMKEDRELNTTEEGQTSETIEGFDELPEDIQEKFLRALEQEHVDDEDWRGDKECNVPGSSGKFMTAAQKKKKTREEEEAKGNLRDQPKKRARTRKEAATDEEEPVPKKFRGKRGKAVEEENSDDKVPSEKSMGRKKAAAKPKKALKKTAQKASSESPSELSKSDAAENEVEVPAPKPKRQSRRG